MSRAYFVKHPRIYTDLQVLHPADAESKFEIVNTVELSAIDYENFLYGMDADRQFIEDNAYLCDDGSVKKCIFVKEAGKIEGILVVPDPNHPSFVGLAAYLK